MTDKEQLANDQLDNYKLMLYMIIAIVVLVGLFIAGTFFKADIAFNSLIVSVVGGFMFMIRERMQDRKLLRGIKHEVNSESTRKQKLIDDLTADYDAFKRAVAAKIQLELIEKTKVDTRAEVVSNTAQDAANVITNAATDAANVVKEDAKIAKQALSVTNPDAAVQILAEGTKNIADALTDAETKEP